MPVPAGPIPKVIVCLRIESTYRFWLTRLRRDLGVAVPPDDVLEDLGRALVLVERAGDRLDRPRRDLVALLDQVDQLVDHRRGGLHVAGVAVQREDVAAQEEVAVR